MEKRQLSLLTSFLNPQKFFREFIVFKGLKKGICIFRYPFLYFYIVFGHYICHYENQKNNIHSIANSICDNHNRNEFIDFLLYLTLT